MKQRSVPSHRPLSWLAPIVVSWTWVSVGGQEPIRLQISDDPLPYAMAPTLADPGRDHVGARDVEPLPPVNPNAPAYSRMVTEELTHASQMLDTLQRELQHSDGEVVRQFSRMRQGLDRLDDRFRTQTARQQELLRQMEAARRAAEHAAAEAAAERQRMAALLSEPPWREAADTGGHPQPMDPESGSDAAESPRHIQPGDNRPGDTLVDRADAGSSEPSESSLPASAPVPLVNSTVDRMRLADSLYGAGQYDVALKIYAELANDTALQTQRPWLFLQLAGCYRHLGDDAAAARYYRMVAGMKQDQQLGDTARWWLRHLEQRQSLQQGLQAIRTAVATPED